MFVRLNKKGITSLVLHVLGLIGIVKGVDIVGETGGEQGVSGAYDALVQASSYIALVIGQVIASFNRTKASE